ncbi:MAG: aminopeptidase [Trueperaceae bacterium]
MTFDDKLQQLAEVGIKIGLNLQEAQDLVLSANIEHTLLVRKLVAEAYKVGAKTVVVRYNDDEDALSFCRYTSSLALESTPQQRQPSVNCGMLFLKSRELARLTPLQLGNNT